MIFKNTLLAASFLLAVPQLAQAQPISGLYVGGGAGINFLQNEKIEGSSLPHHMGSANTAFQPGWVGVGSVGYGLGNGLRLEVEGNYRTNHPRTSGAVHSTSDGSETKYGAMVNALYDFNTAGLGVNTYGISPYVGVGAGWVHNNWHGLDVADGANNVHINSSVNAAAYQAIAGVAVPLDSITPGLAMTVEYRFVTEPSARKYDSLYSTGGGGYATGSKVVNDVNHSILVGLRYAFNTPVAASAPVVPVAAVAAVPAPAPEAARTYLLFFDWDKADLSARAQQIVADAAHNATRVQYTRIDVTGNADLTGTHEYNMSLSRRRADAVASELVRDGVPKAAIQVIAAGDTKPLVPTAEGVREPQNRRVEIVIH
jgi:outer membrane protein OmpA-like peptidoglycan-associated protein